MSYLVTESKEQCFAQLKLLIDAFNKEYSTLKKPKYNEAQLRIDFINPMLKTFGWDVDNEFKKSQFLRDVNQEEPIDISEDDITTKKKPDYSLNVNGSKKLFIEAKKVSVDIDKSISSAFQTRRYGWNANLGISILTNFERLVVYDCRYKPVSTDLPSVARYISFHFSEYLTNFDELYNLLSFQSIASGYIDDYFSLTHKDLSPFDDYFLTQIETWRKLLATDIVLNNKGFNEEDINFLIQRLLNRIVFLRICEDREIEKYETLRRIKNYEELKTLFIASDKKYNSGLFDFIEDHFSLKINLKSEILISIFNELYYPESPYNFSVVDPSILSQIYERYLGSKIIIIGSNEISIVEEPEIAASSGVVPTPKLVVENIVKEALTPLFDSKNLKLIELLKLAVLCCVSGTFLLSVYDIFLEKLTLLLASKDKTDDKLINKSFDGSFTLTLRAKQNFLINNIFGVDVNPYAVEVAKYSLLLKLLENENAQSIKNYLDSYKEKVLPSLDENIKCGNSLVDNKYFEFSPESLDNDTILYKVKPFNWNDEFPFLKTTGGFDAIVGNPPYVRIQNMVKYLSEEIKYYQSKTSGYTVAEVDTFDKYYLFIQRAISLINENGVLGYIVPNKFFIARGGEALREFLSSNCYISKIIHFGVTQVFPNRSTYTAVIIVDKHKRTNFQFTRVKRITTEFIAGAIKYVDYNIDNYKALPWVFVSKEAEKVFNKIRASKTVSLKSIAEITVGLQTSADKIYIFQPSSETKTTYYFKRDNIQYEIEKAVCKPCLYDLSFGLFDTVIANAQMIFPYIITEDKAEPLSEEFFQENYPLTWKYLCKFKVQLSKRSINGSKNPKWYQFGRSQSLTKFHNNRKLIWPVLSTKPSYIYDNNNIQFTGGGNGPYYSLISNSTYSPLFLLGILSHPVFEAMVKAGASEFRGAYYSHGKQFLENIPIKVFDFKNKTDKKNHDAIVKTVQQLIETKQSYNQVYIAAKKKILERKLNFLNDSLIEQINQLYSISKVDVDIVLTDEIFINDLNED